MQLVDDHMITLAEAITFFTVSCKAWDIEFLIVLNPLGLLAYIIWSLFHSPGVHSPSSLAG